MLDVPSMEGLGRCFMCVPIAYGRCATCPSRKPNHHCCIPVPRRAGVLFEHDHAETPFLCGSAGMTNCCIGRGLWCMPRLLARAGTDFRKSTRCSLVCASESRGAVGACPGLLSCAGA